MGKSIPLHWIAQAEARSVREKAVLHHCASEPNITGLYTPNVRNRPPWVKWFRASFRAVRRKTVATRSSSAEEDFDRVLVTILITDIVNSTKQVAEVGDRAWRILLNRHDDATRDEIRRFGGLNVGNRGDGFVSIFDSPARAVRCAAAIAGTIAPLGISIRCGLHVGEVHVHGKEISGIAVHIAARIAAGFSLRGLSSVTVKPSCRTRSMIWLLGRASFSRIAVSTNSEGSPRKFTYTGRALSAKPPVRA